MRKLCTPFMFLLMLLFALNTFAQQLQVGILVGKAIIGGIIGNKGKRQEKTIEKSESRETVNGTALTILRVKDADIKSKAKVSIIKVQNRLDEYAELCKSGSHLNIPKKDSDIYNIQKLDSDWPTSYYENELKAYKKYELKLVLKENHTKDSLAAINNVPIRKAEENLVVTNKAVTDTIVKAIKIQEYSYLNKAFAVVKESSLDNAKTLGVLYVGSYVKLINPEDQSQFVKISFHGNQGFIDKSLLVDNIDKITVANADLNTYKKSVYCRYLAKP